MILLLFTPQIDAHLKASLPGQPG